MKEEIQGLKPERIQDHLVELPEWQQTDPEATTIEWRQTYSSFTRVVQTLVDIEIFAEHFERIPDISVQSNGLTVRLGMNGLTEADLKFAKAISKSC